MINQVVLTNEKMNKLIEDINDSKEFETKIFNMFVNEFEEIINNILVQSESEFMLNFSKRMDILFREEYSDECCENEILNSYAKLAVKKIYDNFYKPTKNLLMNAISDYEIASKSIKKDSVINLFFSQNFRKHCINCDDFAFHSCKGNFIPVYTNYRLNLDTENLLEKIPKEGLKFQQIKSFEFLTYVVCVSCKKAYLSKEILMFCYSCNINFHTTVVNSEDLQLQPATWEQYHCKAMMNDTMKCINCKATFFINTLTNMLECKKCNFSCNPFSIMWKCIICTGEFSSNAKIYNQLEFNVYNRAIKYALIQKKIIKPLEVTCCKVDIENTNFFHKKECNGPLYEGNIDDQVIVVCGMCKVMNFFLRFIWTCPKCYKRFNMKKILLKQISNESNDNGIKMANTRKSVLNDMNYGKKLNMINDKELLNQTKKEIHFEKKKTAPPMKQFSMKKLNKDSTNVKQALQFTPYENVKGISMLRYTKIISRKDKNEENAEEYQIGNNILTTAMSTEQELENEKFLENKGLNKQALKNSEENERKIDYDKRIIKPRNLTPSNVDETNKKAKMEEEKRRKNLQLLNPFKYKRTSSVSHGINKTKKEFEETKRKNNNDVSPLKMSDSKNHKTIEDEDCNQSRKIKNLNINLNFHTIDNINNNDQGDLEELKNDFCEENLKEIPDTDEKEINLNHILPYFIVEDYRFVHQIGDGSYGSIYLCMDKNEQTYAIKKIFIKEKIKIDQICNEFELAHQLKHKNILKIFGISKRKLDSTTQVLYVLMELAQSDWKYDILMRMKEKNYYTENELISIVSQIIEALAFMQTKNIAHRDIKPENILSFKDSLYKVADFGCAKEMKNNNLNTLKGTEYFISPALYNAFINNIASEGVEHNAIKSDVFSLGLCILYAATLTINPIIEIRNISDPNVLYNFLKKYLSKYSQSLVNFVYRMLDLNEELRFDFLELTDCLKKK